MSRRISSRARPLPAPASNGEGGNVFLMPWPSELDVLHRQRGSVSVVIPVLNESRTVASVVRFARRNPLVDEVIVVDDGSIDGTPELAETAGATVITSKMLGKGASMEDGMRAARNPIVLFLDGDLRRLRRDTIDQMVRPILLGQADFVKARFARRAGRVTVLTARPLLRTYFPELAHFEQPLSGVMAAKRTLLLALRFENDYGVDVGLLIDAAAANARLAEVDIGRLEHDSHPLDALGEMATQVSRTILYRAAACGRLRPSYMREVAERERHGGDLSAVLASVPVTERIALFDMDGVLLQGRFIVELARRTDRAEKLAEYLDNNRYSLEERTRRIARLFRGVSRHLFEQTAMDIPLTPGAIDAVIGLRKAGYRVGIVTDSYQVVAETVRRRVFADFSFANLIRFKHGKASGNVTLCPATFHPAGCSRHKHCKSNVLRHLAGKLGITPEHFLAVGDGENDICMLQLAGQSLAFEPKSPRVAAAAQHVAHGYLCHVLRVLPATVGI